MLNPIGNNLDELFILPADVLGDEAVPIPPHLADDPAVDEPQDPVGLLGHVHVVGDEDEGLVHLAIQLSEELIDHVGALGVEGFPSAHPR